VATLTPALEKLNMRILIGYDEREAEAARTALKSLHRVSRLPVELLDAEKLAAHGLLNRISDHRGGQDFDLVSNAKKSTRFAISRFLTPILAQEGYCLFADCDVVFLRNPEEMLREIEPGKAVYVVKHDYTPSTQWKMVNQSQAVYPRKNWSSVMLFDCHHPANRRLTLWDVNNRPGRDLHRFYWLHDDEIGDLSPSWNWLVGEQPKPDNLGIAHFTLGGPWIPGWKGAEHDDLWVEASR
jgi:hypothetical protein